LLFASTVSVFAQTPSGFGGDLNPLFQGILSRPSDLSNTLQYAALAPSSDVESAISTYEQLLFYNPKLSRCDSSLVCCITGSANTKWRTSISRPRSKWRTSRLN
jgi:hypothetical protein